MSCTLHGAVERERFDGSLPISLPLMLAATCKVQIPGRQMQWRKSELTNVASVDLIAACRSVQVARQTAQPVRVLLAVLTSFRKWMLV